jgi:alcohol dehydrogenase
VHNGTPAPTQIATSIMFSVGWNGLQRCETCTKVNSVARRLVIKSDDVDRCPDAAVIWPGGDSMKNDEALLDRQTTDVSGTLLMKALVFHGPDQRSWEDKPRPTIREPGDAIVRITTSTICGTDLHILKGDVPSVTAGRILGHEGVGIIETVGSSVASFRVGDRVLISCITACGICDFCRRQMPSHCRTGGWILGNTIDGTQAEYVRIPHAETSLYPVPPQLDAEAVVMLSDILPTAYECGVLNGEVTPGDTIAIVGAGPIGLAVLMAAQLYSPGAILVIDLDAHRLEMARQFGATSIINSGGEDVVARVLALTSGAGVDVAIEAVGTPAAFDTCQAIVAAGGRIANIGVHGKPVQLHLERLWDRNIVLTTRLVDTVTTPLLLKLLRAGKLQPAALVTHRFRLDDIMPAYDTFANAARVSALKVILHGHDSK